MHHTRDPSSSDGPPHLSVFHFLYRTLSRGVVREKFSARHRGSLFLVRFSVTQEQCNATLTYRLAGLFDLPFFLVARQDEVKENDATDDGGESVLSRLRTCGGGHCGALATASGGLRYYTAPSQRRMQNCSSPRLTLPLFLSYALIYVADCSVVALTPFLSLSSVARWSSLSTGTLSRGTIFQPPSTLAYCVTAIVSYIHAACCDCKMRRDIREMGCMMYCRLRASFIYYENKQTSEPLFGSFTIK